MTHPVKDATAQSRRLGPPTRATRETPGRQHPRSGSWGHRPETVEEIEEAEEIDAEEAPEAEEAEPEP